MATTPVSVLLLAVGRAVPLPYLAQEPDHGDGAGHHLHDGRPDVRVDDLAGVPVFLVSPPLIPARRLHSHQAEVKLEAGRLHARAAAVGLVAALAALGREARALARLEVA